MYSKVYKGIYWCPEKRFVCSFLWDSKTTFLSSSLNLLSRARFSHEDSHKYRVLIPVGSCLIKREADQVQSVCFLVFQQKLTKLGKFGFKRKLQGAVIGPVGCRCYLHIEKRKVKLCYFKYSYSTIPGVF